jgi:Schlafen, AlbA_2
MRPLKEWDEEYIQTEVCRPEETGHIEFKGSQWLNLEREQWKKTRVEIGKQLSAFSNTRDGHLVVGINDIGKYDGGVPALHGNEPLKRWVEKTFPDLVTPSVVNLEAAFIPFGGPNSTQGVLAVAIPQSDRRPHWVTENSHDIAYLRTGEHSRPMPLQTAIDMANRQQISDIEILAPEVFEISPGAAIDFLYYQDKFDQHDFQPKIQLIRGPACTVWAMEIELLVERGFFRITGQSDGLITPNHFYGEGRQTLFPKRQTYATMNRLHMFLPKGVEPWELRMTVYAGSAQSVHRIFTSSAFMASA